MKSYEVQVHYPDNGKNCAMVDERMKKDLKDVKNDNGSHVGIIQSEDFSDAEKKVKQLAQDLKDFINTVTITPL